MNPIYAVFAVPAGVAILLGGWSLRGWYDGRQSKANLLKTADEAISALENAYKKDTTAQQAADDATLLALKNRLHALS